jgi:hypothetical protein
VIDLITIIYEQTDCVIYFCQVCGIMTDDREAHENSVWHQINLALQTNEEKTRSALVYSSVVVIDVTRRANINGSPAST